MATFALFVVKFKPIKGH